MRKLISYLPIVVLLLFTVQTSDAGCFGSCKPQGYCNSACSPCQLVCCAEVKTEKVKKHCWEVECEHICVPRVQCPLLNCLTGNTCEDPCSSRNLLGKCIGKLCGDVKCVRKLKKKEYECEKCVVEWSVKCASGCGSCTGCQKPCCGPTPLGCCQVN